MMGAGFEADVSRCANGGTLRLRKRLRFRMGPSAWLGPATPDDAAVVHDDAAHRRIGGGVTLPAPAQRQGQTHEPGVARPAHSSSGVPGRSSCTNLSKSSAAWKFL